VPLIPVFLPSDRSTIASIVDQVKDEVEAVVVARYEEIRQRLGGISPVIAGMPFGVVLAEVWHAIFAEANRLLIEDGLMAIPSHADPDAARCMAWVTCPGADPRFPAI